MEQAEEQALFRWVKMLRLLLSGPTPHPGAGAAKADSRPDGHDCLICTDISSDT